MLDDVVGLIMVQVISNLATLSTWLSSITVVRPILVFIGLVITIMACYFLVLRSIMWLNGKCESSPTGVLQRLVTRGGTVFLIHTAILVGLVTSATYAGTSNLFAAYLAGASINWWDSEVPHKCLERRGSMATLAPQKGPSDLRAQQTPIAVSDEVSTENVQPLRAT